MFKAWCQKEKLRGSKNLSHVLLTGGCLSVPCDRLDDFNAQYVKAVTAGEKLFVVEQKTQPVYNFFCDIDYKSDEALTVDFIQDVVKVICGKVKIHGGKDCLVSIAPPKDAANGKVKTGVHLNWQLPITQVGAVAMREHILVALYTAKPGYDWETIIDKSVYGDPRTGAKGSGFRLPFSFKRAKCPKCGGKSCDECDDGKITEPPYIPCFIYRTGAFSALLRVEAEPTMEIMRLATVRTDAKDFVSLDSPTQAIREGGFTAQQMKHSVDDVNVMLEVERFVRDNLEGQGEARVTKVCKQENNTFLVSTNSQYCENVKRNHGGNHVWFFVTNEFVVQKCFCTCEILDGRWNGYCMNFVGKRHPLDEPLRERLFPAETETGTETETAAAPPKKQQKIVIKDPAQQRITECFMNAEGVMEKRAAVDPGEEKRRARKRAEEKVKIALTPLIVSGFRQRANLQIMRITTSKNGKKHTAVTNARFCPLAQREHDKTISYEIEKGIMKQVCDCAKRERDASRVLVGADILMPLKIKKIP